MSIKIGDKLVKCYIVPTIKNDSRIQFVKNRLESQFNIDFKKSIKKCNYLGNKDEMLYFVEENKNGEYIRFLTFNLPDNYTSEDLRIIYSKAFKFLKDKKEVEVGVIIPINEDSIVSAVVEGLDLSDYKFDKYLSKKDKHKINFNLHIDKKYNELVKNVLIVNSNTKIVRDMVNENACDMTPERLENISKEFSKKHKLKITVLDEKKIIKEKLNLLYAVGKGSVNPPRLIMVEYNGNSKSKDKLALVGKGITFDTGGLNLKGTGNIETMRIDMGGAATVYGAFKSAVELKLKHNLVLVLSCAENATSGSAYIPGDVFKSYSGQSVEIKNTDAEGRLVLADAISYVQDNFKITKIIDVATLTGACLVALGPSLIAILGNNSKFENELYECGEKVSERAWRLPIHHEHRDLLKSSVADFSNLGGKIGGCISAGAFIEKFVHKNVIWSHLDIAGAVYSEKEDNYVPLNATGRGVRLLVEYLKK